MSGPAAENIPHWQEIGYFQEIIAMGEAQESLQHDADVPAETADGIAVGAIEPAHRRHHPVGDHQQRSAVKMRDQPDEEKLVAELREKSALGIGEQFFA